MYHIKKRILVTGGAGFLGSHLCEKLLEGGASVLCVDNFFTGTKENVKNLSGHPDFEILRHDVTFPLYVEVDEIYNLACPASPIHYQHDPVQTTKTSVHGAINMLGEIGVGPSRMILYQWVISKRGRFLALYRAFGGQKGQFKRTSQSADGGVGRRVGEDD